MPLTPRATEERVTGSAARSACAASPLSVADMQLLLDTSSDVVSRGSNEGVIEWVSPSVEHVLGWAPAQLVGQRFIDLVEPAYHDLIRAVQRAALRGEYRNCEVEFRRSDGAYHWISINLRPMLDGAGNVVGRVAVWRDIHAEVSAREVAMQTLHRKRAALDAMPDPYAVLAALRDDEGCIVDFSTVEANRAACNFMGRQEAELIDVRLSDLMPGDVGEQYIASFRKVLIDGRPLLVDRRPVANGPGGAIRYFDSRAAGIDNDHVGFTFRDVTMQVQHDRARADLLLMDALAGERDRVARDLHDGPIQHVFATGMLLRSVIDHVPGDARADLERVIDAHDDIIRELRATILGLVQPGGAVVLDWVGDPTLVQHLLYSLREMLSNVARHAAARSVEVAITLDDDLITVTVSDDGTGAQQGASGGHGLANLNRRAELLGGSFHLEPRLPSGTVACWTARRSATAS